MGRIKHELWTFCKAQFSAQIATGSDFAVTYLLNEYCGLWYLWASICGSLTGGTVNCAVNYRYVFDPQGVKKKYVAAKYLLVWFGSILLNNAGVFLLTELTGLYFIFVKICVGIVVGVLWNYQLQRFFVYRDIEIRERIEKQIGKRRRRKRNQKRPIPQTTKRPNDQTTNTPNN